MKKLILAAALLAPLAAPSFADEAAGFIETPAVTTYAPTQPREFTARTATAGQLSPAERAMIQREVVPSSATSSSN